MYQHQTSLNLISPWNDVITSPACQLHVYYSNCQIEHKLKTCSNFSGWQGILWTRNVHSRVQTSNDLLTHSILKIRPCERKKRAPYPLRRTNQIRTGNKYIYFVCMCYSSIHSISNIWKMDQMLKPVYLKNNEPLSESDDERFTNFEMLQLLLRALVMRWNASNKTAICGEYIWPMPTAEVKFYWKVSILKISTFRRTTQIRTPPV